MQDSTIVALGCAPFLFGGIVCIALGLRALVLARASRNWKKTQGKIVKSSFSAYGTADVQYEYEVNGQAFQGHRIRFGAQSSGGDVANIIARYPLSSAVDVFYDPAKPKRCTLEKAVWRFFVVVLILGGLSLVAVSVFVIKLSRSFPTTTPAAQQLLSKP